MLYYMYLYSVLYYMYLYSVKIKTIAYNYEHSNRR